MSRGSGIIQRTNKVEPPAAATVTGARNGTSLSGTFVELGGALSPLLHNTTVQLGTFDFIIADAFNEFLFLSPAAAYAALGDRNQAAVVVTDQANSQVLMGDVFGNANATLLKIDDVLQNFELSTGGNPFLSLNVMPDQFIMGNIGAGNNTIIDIVDSTQTFIVSSGPNEMLNLNMSTGVYQIGDLTPSLNQTFLVIDDNATTIETASGGSVNGLTMDFANNNFLLGDFGGTGNGFFIAVNDSIQRITVQTQASDQYLTIDKGNDKYSIGDISTTNNGGYMEIDDTNNAVNFYQSTITVVNGSVFTEGGFSPLIGSVSALTNNAGANIGTLLNAPTAGDPTKWIKINDNGTNRFIPTWT